jgi:hypothetical protein
LKSFDAVTLRFVAVAVLFAGILWLIIPLQRKLGGLAGESAVGFPFVGYMVYAGVAVLSYFFARTWMRRRLSRHPVYAGEGMRFASAAWDMAFMLCFGLIYLAACLLWYSIDSELAGLRPKWGVLIAIGAVAFAATFLLIRDVSSRLFRDLTMLQGKLDALARSSRGNLGSRLPLPSAYESGELAAAFNSLLRRFEQEYDRLEQDLDLAYHVQEQLLSRQISEWQDWKITKTRSQPDRVGGGFYDAWPVSERCLAIMAGCVEGKELPAALVMSALVMMFRTRMGREADDGSWFAELDDALAEVMGDSLRIHIAVAMLDLDRDEVRYAIAGNMRVCVGRGSGPGSIPSDIPDTPTIGSGDGHRDYPIDVAKLSTGECRVELFAAVKSSVHDQGGISVCRCGVNATD